MEQTKRSKAGNARSKAHGRPRRLSVGLLLVGGVSLTLVVIALILVVASGNQQSAAEGADYAGIPAAWQNRNVLGDPEAPITLQAWEDFRCPACAAFNQRVKPGLVENYIASGDLKLEFHHFPLQQHEPGASLGSAGERMRRRPGVVLELPRSRIPGNFKRADGIHRRKID